MRVPDTKVKGERKPIFISLSSVPSPGLIAVIHTDPFHPQEGPESSILLVYHVRIRRLREVLEEEKGQVASSLALGKETNKTEGDPYARRNLESMINGNTAVCGLTQAWEIGGTI